MMQIRKPILIVAMILLPIAVLMIFSYSAGPQDAKEVSGTVLRLETEQTDTGHNLYLIVQLEDGSQVSSWIEDSSQYRKGDKVTLEQLEPAFFGSSNYRLKNYIE